MKLAKTACQLTTRLCSNLLILARFSKAIQSFIFHFTKREDLDVSSAWLPRLLRQRLHHLLLSHFTGASCLVLLQRPLPPCFGPIIGLGHPSRWQFFASGPKIRRGSSLTPLDYAFEACHEILRPRGSSQPECDKKYSCRAGIRSGTRLSQLAISNPYARHPNSIRRRSAGNRLSLAFGVEQNAASFRTRHFSSTPDTIGGDHETELM